MESKALSDEEWKYFMNRCRQVYDKSEEWDKKQKGFTAVKEAVRIAKEDLEKSTYGEWSRKQQEAKRASQAPKAEEPLFKDYDNRITQYDPIIESLLQKFNHRSLIGMVKYGKTMARTDITTLEWLKHAQEEAMDMCVYLERLIADYEQTPRT